MINTKLLHGNETVAIIFAYIREIGEEAGSIVYTSQIKVVESDNYTINIYIAIMDLRCLHRVIGLMLCIFIDILKV